MIRFTMIHHDLDVDVCQVDITKSCGSGHGKHQPTAQLEVEETEELMLLSQTCRFVDDERETNLMNKTNEQKQIDIPDIRFFW